MATTTPTTHYEILGIEPDATQDEITKAFRKSARMFHPDMPHANAGMFRAITEANKVLSNALLRKEYDQSLRSGASSAGSNTADDDSSYETSRDRFADERYSSPDDDADYGTDYEQPVRERRTRSQPTRRAPRQTQRYTDPEDMWASDVTYDVQPSERTALEAIIANIGRVPGRVALWIVIATVALFIAGRALSMMTNPTPDTAKIVMLAAAATISCLGWLVRAGARPVAKIEHAVIALFVLGFGYDLGLIVTPFAWPFFIAYSVWTCTLSSLPRPAGTMTWRTWWAAQKGVRSGATARGLRRTFHVLTLGKVRAA